MSPADERPRRPPRRAAIGDYVAKRRCGLVDARAPGERLADVPVAGVEQPHRSNRANGSSRPGRSAASLCARRPGREGEADLERHRQMRLLQDHRPRLEDRRALAGGLGQEAVLGALGLGRVEPADDADGRVRDDPALDLARGLLGADEDHAEAAAALGDVEQHLLDRATSPRAARTC